MTKLEYLRNSSNVDRVYTWESLGKNNITDTTKIYSKDVVYLVNIPLSSLNGYLLYCKKEYNGNINWLEGSLFDYGYGEITFGNNVVSPYFNVILTYNEFKEIDRNSEAYKEGYKSFQPYSSLSDTCSIIIDDHDYMNCIKVLGAPFIREDELEYTREEICDLAIRPALEEYFHWIPSTYSITANVGTSGTDFERIDMPSDAYAVVGISLQQNGGTAVGNMMSPFYYGMEQSLYGGLNYSSLSGVYLGNARPKTQTSNVSTMIGRRATAQALINYTRRVHYEGPYEYTLDECTSLGKEFGSKYIKVYSNANGVYNVWFAKHTLNFNDVKYEHRTRVTEWAQANVKELFTYLRRNEKSDLPGKVSYDEWLSEAKETKTRILDEYKKIVKASGVIRGSL